MLHRSTSSRRRRASRSAASSPQGRPKVPALTLEDVSPTPPTPSMGRRASVAVTPNTELPQHLRSPRRSPRHSLAPNLDVSPTTPDNDVLKAIPTYDRSPRHSLAPEVLNFNKSPRNSLVPDYNRSPRNSLVPESMNRSPRNSLVPDSALSPRNSLAPNMDRSPRYNLAPDGNYGSRLSLNPQDYNRSPRNSLVPDSGGSRSPRHSLVPESVGWNQARSSGTDGSRSPRHSLTPLQQDIGRSPRGSVVADTALSGRSTSPRGSIAEVRSPRGNSPRGSIGGSSMAGDGRGARGSLTLTFQEPLNARRASDDNGAAGARGRSTSPYRGSTSGRGAQINHAFTSSEAGSRRASSSVSQAFQVSGDEQRRLCEQGGGSNSGGSGSAQGLGLGLAALTTYGSVAYQLQDANMEASGTCDFLCRAITIVNRTVVVTVMLGCLSTLPIIMLIMGIQFLRDCPREPHIPLYMVVGGALGGIKLGSLLWTQLAGTPRAPRSLGPRLASLALSVLLLSWFALGNYWILRIKWPDFKPMLYEPNKWCDKTLYTFSLVHLIIVYSVFAVVFVIILVLAACQLFGCPWLGPTRFK